MKKRYTNIFVFVGIFIWAFISFTCISCHSDPNSEVIRILARGKINTDDEFCMVNEYIDELCQTDNDANKNMIDKLNKLLLDYEEAAAERLEKDKE